MTNITGELLTLADLEPNQRASISSIDLSDPQVLRLMVMGLVEGTAVRFAGCGFGGDPLEFELDGVPLSLRRELAKRFLVENTA